MPAIYSVCPLSVMDQEPQWIFSSGSGKFRGGTRPLDCDVALNLHQFQGHQSLAEYVNQLPLSILQAHIYFMGFELPALSQVKLHCRNLKRISASESAPLEFAWPWFDSRYLLALLRSLDSDSLVDCFQAVQWYALWSKGSWIKLSLTESGLQEEVLSL